VVEKPTDADWILKAMIAVAAAAAQLHVHGGRETDEKLWGSDILGGQVARSRSVTQEGPASLFYASLTTNAVGVFAHGKLRSPIFWPRKNSSTASDSP
jgi:hypothetical protein